MNRRADSNRWPAHGEVAGDRSPSVVWLLRSVTKLYLGSRAGSLPTGYHLSLRFPSLPEPAILPISAQQTCTATTEVLEAISSDGFEDPLLPSSDEIALFLGALNRSRGSMRLWGMHTHLTTWVKACGKTTHRQHRRKEKGQNRT